jgi:two-component system chemotaxis sensor kinase CheA
MDPIVNEFLVESHENLDQLDKHFVDLEQDPTDKGLLSGIFRTIHTIKGTCGFLGFSKLESIAHVGENLLSKLRDGELALSEDITNALLAMVDAIRQILSSIENQENEGDVDYSSLVETLTRLNSGGGKTAAPAPAAPEPAPVVATGGVVDSGNEAMVKEFLVESYENLDQLDKDFVALEQNPTDKNLLSSIFRTIHTIKGTCGFLGFSKLESVAHVGENLLSKLRDGALPLTPEITNTLLAMVDAIRQILGAIENEKNEGTVDYSSLVKALTLLNEGKSAAGVLSVVKSATPPPMAAVAEQKKPDEVAAPADEIKGGVERRQQDRTGVADASIRVDVSLLDTLMNLVGELVLARNQILQFSPPDRDTKFLASAQSLNLITTQLQEGVMKTRMQPIGNIWDKFPRVVRDLSMSCGKQVRLEMEGKETELDKTLIEAIKDPMTHIVRNAVDHGIEMPDVRRERGKNPEGTLKLRAYHEGGQVNVEISDDGGGISPDKIRKKAVEKGLITPEQATRMSDREVINLIFLPGFSMAEKVSNISGRGVGMDVVKTNIEKIGGTVDIQSVPGQGSTLKVKIPLTLAIIPALIVTCGENRYAIPQVNLQELVRLDGEDARKNVEMIQGTPVYRLRGNLLPLIYLDRILQVKQKPMDAVNIVVLQADGRLFGLVVGGINDTEEIVVKPLGKHLKGINALAGATIMGDGRIALILDVIGMAHGAHLVYDSKEKVGQDKKAVQDGQGDRQTLLVFGLADSRIALPLSMVARLEEFKLAEVERSGDQSVVQYRGEIMPLIYLSRVLHHGQAAVARDPMPAVVYTCNGRSVGLVVDRVIDIIEQEITVKRNTRRPGVVGTIVVQNLVTDLLDVEGVIREEEPSFFEEAVAGRKLLS